MEGVGRLSIVAAVAASLGAGARVSSSAQQPQQDRMYRPAEATIYRDAAYRGPAVFIGEEKPNLGLAWPVNSLRVASGAWELCEKTRLRGTCRTVVRDTPILGHILRVITVRSMRPIGGTDVYPAPLTNDQCICVNFAEFHTQPTKRGTRDLTYPA